MNYGADSQSVAAFVCRNAGVIADAEISHGYFERDPFDSSNNPIDYSYTLRALRAYVMDFIESGCRQKTYVLDCEEQMGVPSEIYYNGGGRCYLTIALSYDGVLRRFFTWTSGSKPLEDEIKQIDFVLQVRLSDGEYICSEIFPVSPKDEF